MKTVSIQVDELSYLPGLQAEFKRYCYETFGPRIQRLSNKKKRRIWEVGPVRTKMVSELNEPAQLSWPFPQDPVLLVQHTFIDVKFRDPRHASMFALRWK